jgi:hypothetical protein
MSSPTHICADCGRSAIAYKIALRENYYALSHRISAKISVVVCGDVKKCKKRRENTEKVEEESDEKIVFWADPDGEI